MLVLATKTLISFFLMGGAGMKKGRLDKVNSATSHGRGGAGDATTRVVFKSSSLGGEGKVKAA